MNDNTAKLLEQLAHKLGTTTEYLWSILLKQAALDATTTLLQVIAVFVASAILLRTHLRLMKKEKVDGFTESGYGRHGDGVGIAMLLAGLLCAVLVIKAFLAIGDIVNGYFNPEYWALKRVLDTIGH
jgi:hypothetical protein